MSTPRVSVVVPIYNVERYLLECLESLAHQSLRDLEVVMVDDGSTDSSASIAAAFAASDLRFRLVQQPNGGLGNARNVRSRLCRCNRSGLRAACAVLAHSAACAGRFRCNG